MACTKKAKIKVSTSGGDVKCLCFRHTFMFVRAQIPKLGLYDFGLYLQKIVDVQSHEVSEEARHAVTLPEDRVRKQEILSVFKQDEKEDWEF